MTPYCSHLAVRNRRGQLLVNIHCNHTVCAATYIIVLAYETASKTTCHIQVINNYTKVTAGAHQIINVSIRISKL
jgi:hypothetical protein